MYTISDLIRFIMDCKDINNLIDIGAVFISSMKIIFHVILIYDDINKTFFNFFDPNKNNENICEAISNFTKIKHSIQHRYVHIYKTERDNSN